MTKGRTSGNKQVMKVAVGGGGAMPSKSDESSVMAEEVGAKRSKEDLELETTCITTRGKSKKAHKNEKNTSKNIDTTKKVSEGAWRATVHIFGDRRNSATLVIVGSLRGNFEEKNHGEPRHLLCFVFLRQTWKAAERKESFGLFFNFRGVHSSWKEPTNPLLLSRRKSQHSICFQDLVKTCDRHCNSVCRSLKRVSTKTVNENKREISEGYAALRKSRRASEIRLSGKVRTRKFFEAMWVFFGLTFCARSEEKEKGEKERFFEDLGAKQSSESQKRELSQHNF